jgi:ubiquinol-cytochrome c reductase cytochrome c subunit
MRRRWTSWTARLAVLGAVAGAAFALTAALHSGWAAAGPGPAYRDTGSPDVGRQVFLRDCAWCHGIDAQGTSRGPDLRNAGPAYVDFMLRTGRMPLLTPDATHQPPRQRYDSATISALVHYVGEELGTGEPLPQLSAGDVPAGRTVFLADCAACHGSSGTGTILQDGTRVPQLYNTPSEQIAEAVRVGPGEMPPFGDRTVDDQELDDVVSYVQQLGPAQVHGGHPLDQYGPIAESLLAFAVPLPLLVLVIVLIGRRAPRQEADE